MKHLKQIRIFLMLMHGLFIYPSFSQDMDESSLTNLRNPVTVSFLLKHLERKSPKLILTPVIEREIKRKLKSDPYVEKYYNYLKSESLLLLQQPLLERELQGFRLLAVSRDMVERMGILSMVYRIEKDPKILARIDSELKAVCSFEDWNPQHYLDVAEMSFGVAIAVDWVGQWLPQETVSLAKLALIEKGIKPSFNTGGIRMGWINGSNNWNAVCHGGMIAASLVIADVDPELAAKTISRALEKLPNSLKEYAPDGVYPEGPTYWGYGTSYSVVAANTLRTALGTDFGISASPGFMESVDFLLHVTAPTGDFFNFADSGDRKSGSQSVLMLWFAAMTGNALYFDAPYFENIHEAGRFAGHGLVWLAQYNEQKHSKLPLNWHGKGANHVAVFRGGMHDPNGFYLGVKGGRANLSHGNMDAGTFVFDLYGIRWVLDPGNQAYYPLNKIGFHLSDHSQDGERWTLLTKKNQGHSTVTVNDARFIVGAKAKIINFKDGGQPEVTIDLSEVYGENVNSLTRRVVKESNLAALIEDNITISDQTKVITWGLMTTAEVQLIKNGAVLKKDGKEVHLSILSPQVVNVSLISLEPPPMSIDKTIEGLKRIEIRIPAWTIDGSDCKIQVRLSGK